jgi:hypothetical protein
MANHLVAWLGLLATIMGSACGPTIASGGDTTSAGDDNAASDHAESDTVASSTGAATTESPDPPTTTTTTGDTCGPIETDGDFETGGTFGGCVVCHDGFLLEFFPVGGTEAEALLPTQRGGFVAVGGASIAWLDADGNITAHGGPYADGLTLEAGAWDPDGGLVLAGRLGLDLWVGTTDPMGILVDKQILPAAEGFYQRDISVIHHPDGIFVSAHLGVRHSEAVSLTLVRLDHELWHVSSTFNAVPAFTLTPSVRSAAVLTPAGDIVVSSRDEDGLLLLRRPNDENAMLESAIVDVPGLPADLAALSDDGVVTASNDTLARIARVQPDGQVTWLRSLSVEDATWVDRITFDATHELVFAAGTVHAPGSAARLWLHALDVHGDDVWMWTGPPAPEGPNTPALAMTSLPEGGAAASTFGSLWYVVIRPWAC